jgi:CHAT domain-containing protein
MASKKSRFFERFKHLLEQVRARVHRLGTLLLLFTLFSIAAVLPTFTHVAAQNAIVQNVPDAEALEQQGRTLYEAEQFSEAVRLWQQAVDAFKAQGDELSVAMTLSNLSLAYQQLGQWQEAEETSTKSLNFLETERNLGDSKERVQILAQSLDVRGRLQLSRGQAEAALSTWQRAESIYARVGDEAARIRSLINQAQALQVLGHYRQAQKILTQLKQTLQNLPDSSLKAIGLRSLGNILRLVGNLGESRQVLEQSLQVAQSALRSSASLSLKSPQAVSDTLFNLGNTARAQADNKAALEYYQQAAAASTSPTKGIQAQLNQLSLLLETKQLSIAQSLLPKIQPIIAQLPPSRKAVYARINFAQSLTRLKQNTATDTPSWLDIAQLLSTAIEQAKSLKDSRAESYALGTLGGLYEQTQQLADAGDLTQQALQIAQAIAAPDIAYQWQWQLGRLKAREDIKGALAAYDEAFKTLQSLRGDLVAINPDVQFSFRESVEPVYRQFVDLLLRPQILPYQGEEEKVQNQNNLHKAREVIEALQLAELDNFFREACLAPKQQLDAVVDKQAPTAAIFYPIILPDRIEVILKLPQQPLRHYATPIPQAKVESTIEQLRQKLTQPFAVRETQSLSQQVYNWLILPILTELRNSKSETLVFVLDGSLRNIPTAALYDGKQYLVENYSIALAPGLQLVDPKPLKQEQVMALMAGLTQARLGFSALPNVERELEQIESEVPSQVLLNEQFTSAAFQDRVNSRAFPVVHLATHGVFSSNADKTFILAWDKPIKVNELNNLLRTRDESRPDTIELLVLSACQTAKGDKRAALGLAGVAVRAGARSTVASLWSINDESTALLMSQFYQELANQSLSKAEALRRAQLALLKNPQPQYHSPSLWSPFVLVGNWL